MDTWDLGRPASPTPGELFNTDCLVAYSWNNVIMNPSPTMADNSSGYVTLRPTGPITIAGTAPTTSPPSATPLGCGITTGSPYSVTFPFATGHIKTKSKRADLVGTEELKIEARCRIPANIQGSWPAFWLWQKKEIDIFEFFGELKLATTVHDNPDIIFNTQKYQSPNGFEGWHTYGLVWNKYTLKFYFDGILIRRINGLHNSGNTVQVECGQHFASGVYNYTPSFPDGFLESLDNDGNRNTNWMSIIFGSGVWNSSNMSSLPIDFDIDWVRMYKRIADDDERNLCAIALDEVPQYTHLCSGDEFTLETDIHTGRPTSANITWTTTPNLTIVDSGNWGITVRANGVPYGNSTSAKITAIVPGDVFCSAKTLTRWIDVGKPPTPTFYYPEIQCSPYGGARIFVGVENYDQATDYSWNFGGTASVVHDFGGYIEAYAQSSNASIPLVITATNQCGVSTFFDRIEYNCTDGNGWQRISVSPNPTIDHINVKFENFSEDTFQETTVPVYIYDNTMSLVKTVNQGSVEQEYDLLGTQHGTHYLFTVVEGKVYTAQFMVDLE